MSSVLRTQGITQIAATLVNTVLKTIDIPRPQTTPAQPAYAEGSDHVIASSFIREEEAGHVVVDLPSTFVSANIFLRKLSIKKLLPTAQKGLQDPSSAFFPSGAPTDSTLVRDLVDTGTANTLATNSDSVRDLLGNPRATPVAVRSFPGLSLRAGEFVHMELFNNTGGDLTATINAVYKLGLNQGDDAKP